MLNLHNIDQAVGHSEHSSKVSMAVFIVPVSSKETQSRPVELLLYSIAPPEL